MSGDVTTVIVKPLTSDILNINSTEITILNTSAATLTVPAPVPLSNAIPLTPLEIGSAGTSTEVARADHIHPILDMDLNGGNF